ncbi:MAG TPA: 2-C-methyl-D-erythritol 4-phosphate cytidylyltransferase [Burkholderiales bacterium]|nr:2-C-methyl-D-erythritol 4-phosphate cytidylyltransferase [Burkholderiales bacterium]HVJ25172.1 2-C-methyl-D-erythritol 4-phosphate cytidylyltransferase [Burkholderiales bacterium]
MSTFALIPAAGTGSRIAAGAPKQYLPLAGRPMLWHAVRAVCVPPVEAVFVVLAPGDATFAAHDWSAFGEQLEPLYCGGETRRDSVFNGIIAAKDVVEADDWLLVHDAARPCLPRQDLEKLVRETRDDEVGGILALPVAETVKRAMKDRIDSTEDREHLWLAQTPQMFRAGLLAQALRRAKGAPTDEAAAVEQMGLKPRLVTGSRENLKVTWPEDLAIAESILKGRQ